MSRIYKNAILFSKNFSFVNNLALQLNYLFNTKFSENASDMQQKEEALFISIFISLLVNGSGICGLWGLTEV